MAVQIIGHRGAAGLAPENTFKGFAKGLELELPVVECDVRLSRDGALVIMHDATVDRTTDGTGPVAELTLAEIRKLDAGDGEQVPVLSEVLEFVKGKAEILVEIKAEQALEGAVECILEHGMEEEAVVTSFQHELLVRARSIESGLRTGAIFRQAPPNVLERVTELAVEGLGIRWNHLEPDVVSLLKGNGFGVRGWAANEDEAYARCLEVGVDGITTDYPDRLLAFLAKNA